MITRSISHAATPTPSPNAEPLRVIVVDDEPLARQVIAQLLSEDAAIELVAACASGEEAIEATRRLSPDVLFLDVRMPGCDGITVVERLGIEHAPYIVFVTAYDRFAIDAFRLRAVDYVLKPVQPSRLREAVSRARELKRTRTQARTQNPAPIKQSVMIVRTGNKELVIPVDAIDWIEADSYYSRLHVEKRSYLLRERMHVLETRLDPAVFARVHRSAIVNLERVREMRHEPRGRHVIVLTTGAKIRASRQRWTEFAALMQERAR